MTQEELNAILENHKKWLQRIGGERANLSGADLCGADLCGADLRGVRYNEQTAYYAMQCPEVFLPTAYGTKNTSAILQSASLLRKSALDCKGGRMNILKKLLL